MRNLENRFRLDKNFGYFTYVYVLLSWKIPKVWRIRSSKKVQRVKNSAANFECCNSSRCLSCGGSTYCSWFCLKLHSVSKVNTSSDSNDVVGQWEFIRIKWRESIEIQQDLAMRTFARDISRVASKIAGKLLEAISNQLPEIFSSWELPQMTWMQAKWLLYICQELIYLYAHSLAMSIRQLFSMDPSATNPEFEVSFWTAADRQTHVLD